MASTSSRAAPSNSSACLERRRGEQPVAVGGPIGHGRRAGTRRDARSSLSFSGGAARTARAGLLGSATSWARRAVSSTRPRRRVELRSQRGGVRRARPPASPRRRRADTDRRQPLEHADPRTPAATTSKRPSPSGITRTMRATVPIDVRTSPPPTSLPRSMSTTPNSGTSGGEAIEHELAVARLEDVAAGAARRAARRCRAGTSARCIGAIL